MTYKENKSYVKGYVYGADGYYDRPFIFEDTPKNISSFIVQHSFNKCVITDLGDNFIVSSMVGGFIDRCPNQEYLVNELHPCIIPLQMGDEEPIAIKYLNGTHDIEMVMQ